MLIPEADTPEREAFDKTHIGFLVYGKFVCMTCRETFRTVGDNPAKVFGINIAPYSAVCFVCKQIVIDGCHSCIDDSPLTIF